MRVVIISGDFPPRISGVGDYAWHLAKGLAKLGLEMEVITGKGGENAETGASNEVSVRRSVVRWNLRNMKMVMDSVSRGPAPFIVNIQYHCPEAYRRNPMINILPLVLRRRVPGARTVVTLHALWDQSLLYRIRSLPMVRWSHGVIFVQRESAGLVKAYCGSGGLREFLPITSNVEPEPCDDVRRKEWRREVNVGEDDFVVVFFGAACPFKGFEDLLGAVEILREREDRRTVLLWVGGFLRSGGKRYHKWARRIERSMANEPWIVRREFPSHGEVSRCLHVADVAVFPFKRGVGENSGSTLAALGHGLPTIVREGITTLPGYFPVERVRGGGPEALAEAIGGLMRSPERREELGRKGSALMAGLTWQKIAIQTREMFKRVLAAEGEREGRGA